MKIKYKIATHDAEVGDVVDLDDVIANVLIILGFAIKTRKKPGEANENTPQDEDANGGSDEASDGSSNSSSGGEPVPVEDDILDL